MSENVEEEKLDGDNEDIIIYNNRKRLVDVIKRYMEAVEGEDFHVKYLDLYSPLYTIFGENHFTCSALLIGNNIYNDWIEGMVGNYLKDYWPPKYVTDDKSTIRYNGYLRSFNRNDDGFKSMVISYYNFIPRSVTDFRKLYPYLQGPIMAFLKHAEDTDFVNKVIAMTEEEIKQVNNNSIQESEEPKNRGQR